MDRHTTSALTIADAANRPVRPQPIASPVDVSSLTIDVAPLLELDAGQRAAWKALQRANPHCQSPLFSYEFTRAVAEVRGGVETAIIRSQGRIVGFFPYYRRGRHAEPVAGRFSDFQGTIGIVGLNWQPRRLLEAAGLRGLRFNNLLACETSLLPFHWKRFESPWMDLSQGYDAYLQQCREAGGSEQQEALRKGRKLAREVAPTRFELHSDDPLAFERLIEWKRAHLEAQRTPDAFDQLWSIPLLARIASLRTDAVQGRLSVWYVGDTPAAINLGVQCGDVLHGWVMSYNREFARYSPGSILLLRLAEAAAATGVRRIDMGAGNEAFKRRFATGATPMIRGAVYASPVVQGAMQSAYAGREALRGTPIERAATGLVRRFRYFNERARRTFGSHERDG